MKEENCELNTVYGLIAIKLGIKTKEGSYRPIIAMLDTGACVNLIEAECLQGLEVEDSMEEKANIFSIDRTAIQNQGKVKVKVKVGQTTTSNEMVVVNSFRLPTPIVIGRDYLRKRNIDFAIQKRKEGNRI